MLTQQIAWTIIAAALILFWLAFAVLGTPKIETSGAIVVMQYGRVLGLLALIFALAPPTLLGTLAWRLAWRNEQTLAIAGCCFLGLSLLAGLLLIEVVRVRIVVTMDGITRHSPWTGGATMNWMDVKSVRWSTVNRWYVIRADAAVIRVSQYLRGQGEFRHAVVQHVAAERRISM